MKFSKWRGLGGDFIITMLDKNKSNDYSSLSRAVCNRKLGIGADGFVTLCKRGSAVFEMKAYDSDGKETAFCGNAVRCACMHIKTKSLIKSDAFELITAFGTMHPEILGGRLVKTDIGSPALLPGGKLTEAISVSIYGKKYAGTALSLHGDHIVVFVDDIRSINLENASELASMNGIKSGSRIAFAEKISEGLIRMKVWRAFDGQIADCGISSCAVAAAGALSGITDNKVSVLLDNGELLAEYLQESGRLYMTGPADEICSGVFNNFVLK